MALLIDNDLSERLLDMESAFAAIEDAFGQLGEEEAAFHPRRNIWSPAADGGGHDLAVMEGSISEPPLAAIRFRSDVVHIEDENGNLRKEKFNVEPGLFMGFVLLFDHTDGELIALLNDGVLQHYRVGATAGVACKYLSREDASTVGMLGSGGMARTYLQAFDIARDLDRVKVYSPTPAHREAYAAEMSDELDLDVTAVDTPEGAVDGVDIRASCTISENVLHDPEWLHDGEFVTNVKSGEIGFETDERADRVFTTAREPHTEEVYGADGDHYRPNAEYQRGYQELDYPTLAEVVSGAVPGREDDSETIVYRNRSAAIQFPAVCGIIYERAQAEGLGTEVPLSWFQQDIRD